MASDGPEMYILSQIKDPQYLTDGDVSWRRHEHTFTYERLLISDRWCCQLASTRTYFHVEKTLNV